MEKLVYVDRRNTNCNKWDGQQKMFGEEGLHAMWVADMDFMPPQCIQNAICNYVKANPLECMGIIRFRMLIIRHSLTGRGSITDMK